MEEKTSAKGGLFKALAIIGVVALVAGVAGFLIAARQATFEPTVTEQTAMFTITPSESGVTVETKDETPLDVELTWIVDDYSVSVSGTMPSPYDQVVITCQEFGSSTVLISDVDLDDVGHWTWVKESKEVFQVTIELRYMDDSPLNLPLGVGSLIAVIIGACLAVVGGFVLAVRSGRSIGLMSWLLIPVGVALVFALAALNNVLKLPLFLDSVGHILAGLLGGPIVGGLTGFLGVLTNCAFQPSAIVWCFQGATIGILVGLLAQVGMFKRVAPSMVSTLIIIATSIVMSSVISIIVYGGIDTYTSSALVVFFQKLGFGLVPAVVIKSTIVEFADKIISVGLPLIVVAAMSSRLLNQFVTGPKLRALKTEDDTKTTSDDKAAAVEASYGSYGEQ